MTLYLAAALLALLAVAALCLPMERARMWRGFLALHSIMGTQFLFAVGLVLALFCAALLRHQGPLALGMALIAFLVCIRAHDLGEPDQERTELDADYDALKPVGRWDGTDEQRARQAGRQAAAAMQFAQGEVVGGFVTSAADFERNRFACAMGLPHPSAEL